MSREFDTNTVPAALRESARRFGDADAVIDGDVRLGYAELLHESTRVSRALMGLGVRAGDRVAVWSPNTHHWILAALGIHAAGASLVPLNTRFKGLEARDILRRSRTRVLLVADSFLGTDYLGLLERSAADDAATGDATGDAAAPERPVAGLLDLESVVTVPVSEERGSHGSGARGPALGWSEFLARGDAVPEEQAIQRTATVSPDDISDIMFTSGTTGRSKGAMSAHRQTVAVAEAWAQCAGVTAGDRYLIVSPFSHTFGYKAGIVVSLLVGAAMIPMPAFDVDETLRLVRDEGVTVLPGAPTIYQSILDHPDRPAKGDSSLRVAVTGAATVPVRLIERMREELAISTILTAYGLTEAVVATMCRPGDDPHTIATTCGRATAGFEVGIAAEDGEPAAPGEDGEVLLRGPNVMLGYLDDLAATADTIDAAGWLHTGDAGQLDEHGYLTITDRLKDMFTVGGFNVYPAEIEQVLARLPGIADSAVVGVPEDRLGEVPKAFVVAAAGHTPTEREVIDFCRERLANYKVPRSVELVAALPRNAGGKVLKRQLRGAGEAGR